ncbi:serine/threonine-protein phosphatase 4 regulatory subunit 4-like isoform X2 [Balaenoptera acutorostrata]|uniref:Serine/threonine-protein phosphatase 4 regulatory subunit 4-like n=1 Tax=Balaenoptera acutorostrata TaxID=9767 RepID=A0ABM3T0K8_BALAC|nr:serine/threonine-protein phosphatase 4 regulatory subunit 4-like [Balaenoptera acutorostrata]XP_057395633.1 serine/threonine-protein phosphatase 4 regulatory subunit 4-like isoform X2 [Balaenoptera acutorostrata]
MHPPPPAAAMDFSQNSLFGYMEDLQELTIIERPVRRSLKTPEEIERLTVDEDLSDIERAVYLLRYFIKSFCDNCCFSCGSIHK